MCEPCQTHALMRAHVEPMCELRVHRAGVHDCSGLTQALIAAFIVKHSDFTRREAQGFP